ncbi:hypothetical protein F5146DRAFT_1134712 [Armillaria mellea]|nr:hypothetical protein F5146DRAFT_1134712 [Armillaria mellea]
MTHLTGWGTIFAFMRYSTWWRKHRRMFHEYFQLRVVAAYYPVQMKATSVLLQQFPESPDETPNMFASMHRQQCSWKGKEIDEPSSHAGPIIIKIVYGYDVNPCGTRGSDPGNLQCLPRWFPDMKFMSLADDWRKDVEAMQEEPFLYASESLNNGTAPSSLVSVNLAKMNNIIGVSEKKAHLEVIRNRNFQILSKLVHASATDLTRPQASQVFKCGVTGEPRGYLNPSLGNILVNRGISGISVQYRLVYERVKQSSFLGEEIPVRLQPSRNMMQLTRLRA